MFNPLSQVSLILKERRNRGEKEEMSCAGRVLVKGSMLIFHWEGRHPGEEINSTRQQRFEGYEEAEEEIIQSTERLAQVEETLMRKENLHI